MMNNRNRLLIRLLLSSLLLRSPHIHTMDHCSLDRLPSEMVVLLAYAIVDTASIEPNAHKNLLTTLHNFSSTDKKIHSIIFDLRCGDSTKTATQQFNNHLINRIAKIFHDKCDPIFLAAAYVATPYALETIVKKHLPEKLLFDLKLRRKLDASPAARKHNGVTVALLQTLHQVLLKFPPSTQHYVKNTYSKQAFNIKNF